MLPVVAGIAAANPEARVRVVCREGRVPWVNLGWPHTVTLEDVEAGKATLHNEVWPQLHESLGGDKLAIEAVLTRQGLWSKNAGVDPHPVEPIISEDARKWADDILTRYFHRRHVVWISPWACARERTWPERRWAELVDGLMCAGLTLAGIRQKDGMFLDGVVWFEESCFPADRTAAMFERSPLVIGNDSGMVHLAGFLGTPAVSVCGPTLGSCVFGNYDSVHVAQATMHCNACLGMTQHYNPRWCRLGCDALHNFEAHHVIKLALQVLAENTPF